MDCVTGQADNLGSNFFYDKHANFLDEHNIRNTSGCNSTQSAKSASDANSSAFRGRNLTATRTLPGTMCTHGNIK